MSGKGSALFNRIHFESGVLRAEQIDPFGTAIVLDEANNVFTVKSASSSLYAGSSPVSILSDDGTSPKAHPCTAKITIDRYNDHALKQK